MSSAWVDFAYLIAAVLFILGLKGLTHPRTAVRGNFLGAVAMAVAVVATLFTSGLAWPVLVAGLAVGAIIGTVLALRIQMTAMPQLVALFNGFGGIASSLVAAASLAITFSQIARVNEAASELKNESLTVSAGEILESPTLATMALAGLIGAVTFSGSFIAFAKLQELKFIRDIRFSGQQAVNLGLLAASVLLALLMVAKPEWAHWLYWLMILSALGLGVTSVISIGGADMPVVIALLNSCSGLAAAATGFVLPNNLLIVAGSLVGASGLILTQIMCKAMNRSLPAVLFGKLQPTGDSANQDEVYTNVKQTSAEEVAMLLEDAQRVVIVPGYGMAVAQAQHAVRDLMNVLTSRDCHVEFGIHPVAGRMPGHMNVLLAEADIPYELLLEMDDINPTLEQADVAIVLGANDTVNPVARTDPQSPIAGMPIIDVDKARTVVVIKRSLSPGFAKIPNPLFAADNSLMLFADGKQAIVDITKAIEDV